ncbi:MAG: hypothetical protein GDA50_00875 [Alphaproteobacteria bacterium GM202ARS2]|nr:hypothetical protein [Alphaproteobacteria bacterium GM202ARS2]
MSKRHQPRRIDVCLASLYIYDAWHRQTPNDDYIWGSTHFSFNNEKGCSWLCVFGEPPEDWRTIIPHPRRIAIIAEPPSIETYVGGYLNQFGIVISPYKKPLSYRGQWHRSPPYISWYYGLKRSNPEKKSTPPYKKWSAIKAPKKKTKRISVVCSGKTLNRFQAQRQRFVVALQQALGTQIDIYGKNDNPIADKADAIDPYRYHIALENNQDTHFWTEKLADSYLGEAYPIYAGCPNLHDYFPRQSYTSINIFNIPQAIEKVKDILASNLYETNKAHILEAKRRVMEEHQLFPAIDRLVRQQEPSLPSSTEHLTQSEPIQQSQMFLSSVRRRYHHYTGYGYWHKRKRKLARSIKKRLPFSLS